MPKPLIALVVSSITIVLNVPMGYWRNAVRKYSVQWFLAIHLAVPLIFLVRVKAGLGLIYVPVLIVSALLGQLIGGRLST